MECATCMWGGVGRMGWIKKKYHARTEEIPKKHYRDIKEITMIGRRVNIVCDHCM